MSTTTDRVMGGYGEAEHNKALGNLLADAKAMPAAEAMDWKAKCIISKSADGFWDVLSACRGWWWHDMAQKWFEQSPHTTCGAYGTRQDAEEALAACPTPYPNFIPSAIEAAREADIGDGLGLDHDQSRRTMGATLAKMPELADSGTANTAEFVKSRADLLAACKNLRAIVHDYLTHAQQRDCAIDISHADSAISRAEGAQS